MKLIKLFSLIIRRVIGFTIVLPFFLITGMIYVWVSHWIKVIRSKYYKRLRDCLFSILHKEMQPF